MKARHLPLQRRKSVVARIAFLEAREEVFARATTARERSSFEYLRATVFAETRREEEHVDGTSVRLDHFIGELARKLSADGPNVQVLLQRFRDVVPESIDCVRCTGHDFCRGNYAVDSRNGEKGLCLSGLHSLFRAACDVAERHYALAPSFRQLQKKEQIIFSTEFTAGKCHDLEIGFAVTGETKHEALDGKTFTEIELKLQTSAFDWGTYMACLYVLFHETICHVHESCALGRERVHPEPTDIFAEGWMDYIALECLRRWLKNPPPGFPQVPPFADDRLVNGQLFHFARCRYSELLEGSAQRHRGRRAASNFLGVVDKLQGAGFGWNPLLQFSTELNVTSSPCAARDRLIGALCDYLPSPGELFCPPKGVRIVRAITDYLGHLDARRLGKEVLEVVE